MKERKSYCSEFVQNVLLFPFKNDIIMNTHDYDDEDFFFIKLQIVYNVNYYLQLDEYI